MSKTVSIGGRTVGEGAPCFVIAEAGSNHDRDLDQAKRLIDVAVAAGADAVKFQTFSADTIAADTRAEIARIDFGGARSLHELYRRLELPREWQRALADHCAEKGTLFLSTPFDEEAVDQLDELGVPAFKLASFELVHLPLLRHVARKGKPVILSTGMATLAEVEEALATLRAAGDPPVVLLHCAINYPPPFTSVNLRAMHTLAAAFGVPVGYSDHTPGSTVPVAAVARGACVIEKHFTIDRSLPGPDHAFALDPAELAAMVRAIRDTEAALGSAEKGPAPDELIHRARGRRSVFARVDIPEGTTITADMLAVLRPGIGLHPRFLDVIVGRTARRRVPANEPVTWDCV